MALLNDIEFVVVNTLHNPVFMQNTLFANNY